MVLARAKQACHEGEVGEVDSTAADKALALIEGAAGELDYLLDNADADPEKKVRKNTEKTSGGDDESSTHGIGSSELDEVARYL